MSQREYTPYQRQVIKRYYENLDAITRTRLAELVSEVYLASGKRADRLWAQIGKLLSRLGVAQVTVDHLLQSRDIEALAKLVQRLTR